MTQVPTFTDDDTGGSVSLQTVLGWIADDDNIIKTQPLKKSESVVFNISIRKKIIMISAAALMSGQNQFNVLCFGALGIQLKHDKKNWPAFIQYISDSSKDGGLAETNAGFAADAVFDEICGFTVTDDKTELTEGGNEGVLVRHNPHGDKLYYVVSSRNIADILKESGIAATLADVSEAMSTKGYKTQKTNMIKIPHDKPIRCWWFFADVIDNIGGSDNE